jgi:hypothetical protein
VSCALFISIETLLENVAGAIEHTFAGIQIVGSWKKTVISCSSHLTPSVIENNLIPMFDYLN